MPEPQRLRARQLSRLPHGVADLLLLPQHDLRVDVADHELQLLRGLAPVHRAEDTAELGRGQQALEDAVAVLAQPQDAATGAEAAGA